MGGKEVRLYGENSNVHQFHSQNDSGDLRGVAGGDGKLECLCGKVDHYAYWYHKPYIAT